MYNFAFPNAAIQNKRNISGLGIDLDLQEMDKFKTVTASLMSCGWDFEGTAEPVPPGTPLLDDCKAKLMDLMGV